MRSMTKKALLALPAAAGLALVPALPAAASSSVESYEISMEELSASGASGTAILTLDGNQLTVQIELDGLAPELVHVQHIHGDTTNSMDFMCPDQSADANGDGIVSTDEGLPDYGDIHISMTTEGDTTPASGLAVDRMPVADADGHVTYERTIEVDDATAAVVQNLHLVSHGIDVDGSGAYDGPMSVFAPDLPLEAEAPNSCGMVTGSVVGEVPGGGVETGAGTTQGTENAALLGIGGAALLAAAGIGVAVSRRRSDGLTAQGS